MRTPLVTIGLPVYNGERYLAAALDSLLAQTFRDFVLVVCDNASTDGTAEIARSYCRRDARVRYHRNPTNIGCPRNFVRAFELAKTPYFRWASSDDLSAPELLERCVDVLERHPDVVQVYARTILIDADSNVVGRYADDIEALEERASDRYIRVSQRIGLCNAIYGMFRADVLRRTAVHGPYVGSDVVVQAEIALYGKIWELPVPLFQRRLHAAAQSAMSAEERAAHYDPAASVRKAQRSQMRHLWERARSVARAPIDLVEKARIGWYLLRGAIMIRDELAAELTERAALHRLVPGRRTAGIAG